MELISSAFKDNGNIPSKYTCDLPAGRQVATRHISPPLTISDVPPEAKALALIMEDIDVPKEKMPSGMLVHWVISHLPTDTLEIPEGVAVAGVRSPGTNGKGTLDYFGPCPPPEYEPSEHRYVFKLYALSRLHTFKQPPTKDEFLNEADSTILEVAELIGRYKRTP